MAVDLCSSSSPAGSPRLSFSRDSPPTQPTNQEDEKEEDPQTIDFVFRLPAFPDASLAFTTPADELFSDGKLKPIHKNALPPHPDPQKKESLKEIIACPEKETTAPSNPPKASSFWRFGRSSSLNCAGGGAKNGGLLPRSRSAGSDAPPAAKQQRRRPAAGDGRWLRKSSSASRAAAASYYYGASSKGGGGGVRISPVLNVAPAFSVKGGGGGGGGFLGLGHLFCSGREKSGGKKKALFSGPS